MEYSWRGNVDVESKAKLDELQTTLGRLGMHNKMRAAKNVRGRDYDCTEQIN